MAQILEVSCDYLLQDGVDEKGNPVNPGGLTSVLPFPNVTFGLHRSAEPS